MVKRTGLTRVCIIFCVNQSFEAKKNIYVRKCTATKFRSSKSTTDERTEERKGKKYKYCEISCYTVHSTLVHGYIFLCLSRLLISVRRDTKNQNDIYFGHGDAKSYLGQWPKIYIVFNASSKMKTFFFSSFTLFSVLFPFIQWKKSSSKGLRRQTHAHTRMQTHARTMVYSCNLHTMKCGIFRRAMG